MGKEFTAICKECSEKFSAREGGGISFHLLHCDKCGKEKSIPKSDIEKADELKEKNLTNQQKVEYFAGQCEDGGNFTLTAKGRCPKCNSDEYVIDRSGAFSLYD